MTSLTPNRSRTLELYDAMRTAFAARQFTDDPLPDDVLARMFDNARFAPSGGNRQGAHVIVVRDPATRSAMAELTLPGARRYTAQSLAGENPFNTVTPSQVSQASIDAVATDERADRQLPQCRGGARGERRPESYRRHGCGSRSPWGSLPVPLFTRWSGTYCWRRRSEGYGGTLTTLPITQEPELKSILHIPDDYAVAALLPLGKPVKQLTRLRRKPASAFVTFESFDGPAFDAL